jgi:hypothetical protein
MEAAGRLRQGRRPLEWEGKRMQDLPQRSAEETEEEPTAGEVAGSRKTPDDHLQCAEKIIDGVEALLEQSLLSVSQQISLAKAHLWLALAKADLELPESELA